MIGSVKIQFCECGCGEHVKPDKRFIRGHNMKTGEANKASRLRNMGNTHGLGCKHSEGVNKTRSLRMVGKKHALGCKHSEESKEGQGLKMVGNRYFLNCKRLEEIRREISSKLKSLWKNPVFVRKQMKSRGVTPNKAELLLNNLLTQILPNE